MLNTWPKLWTTTVGTGIKVSSHKLTREGIGIVLSTHPVTLCFNFLGATNLKEGWRSWPWSGGNQLLRRRGCSGWGMSPGTVWWGCDTRWGACRETGRTRRRPSHGRRRCPPATSRGYLSNRTANCSLNFFFFFKVRKKRYHAGGQKRTITYYHREEDEQGEEWFLLTVTSLECHARCDAVHDDEADDMTPIILNKTLEVLNLLLDWVLDVLLTLGLHIDISSVETWPENIQKLSSILYSEDSLDLI